MHASEKEWLAAQSSRSSCSARYRFTRFFSAILFILRERNLRSPARRGVSMHPSAHLPFIPLSPKTTPLRGRKTAFAHRARAGLRTYPDRQISGDIVPAQKGLRTRHAF